MTQINALGNHVIDTASVGSDHQMMANISGTAEPSQWLIDAMSGGSFARKRSVTPDEAMSLGPWWQGISIISGDVAALPLNLMQTFDERSKRKLSDHHAHRLLNREPHQELLPFDLRETMQAWALSWGNAVAAIIRDKGGRPRQLVPLPPETTRLYRVDGELVYKCSIDGRPFAYRKGDVLHIKGLGSGLWGHSVVRHAAMSIGLGLDLQEYGVRHISNGARPDGVLETDQRTISAPDRERLRREWEEIHRGLENSGKIALLVGGLKYKPTTFSSKDAEILESRRFTREDIAHWLNLPPYKLGAMKDSSVRANLEEQSKSYIETTLERWLQKWEQECGRKLLTRNEREQQRMYFRFKTAARLRGNLEKRYQSYALGRQWGWLSVNDIRELEDMNPIDGGDVYLQPLNMVDANEQPPSPAVKESARLLLDERCASLVSRECERLRRMAKNPKQFLDSVESFYGRWRSAMVGELQAAEPLLVATGAITGAVSAAVEAHCQESIGRILASAEATPDELEDSVAAEVDQWASRARDLVNQIMKD